MLFLITFFISQLSMASDVWITTERLNTPTEDKVLIEEYRKRFPDKPLFSAYEAMKKEPVTKAQLEEIVVADEGLHQLYLGGKFNELKAGLEKSLLKLKTYPLTLGLESIYFKQLVRYAEVQDILEPPSEESEPVHWLAASSWASPTKDLLKDFPPQIVSKLKEVKKSLQNIDISIIAPATAHLLLDGKKIEFAGDFFKASIPEGPHQLALLMPGSQWTVLEINVTEKESFFRVIPQALIVGACHNPEYRGPFFSRGKKIIVAFESGCERVFDGKTWFSLEGKKVEALNQMPTVPNMGFTESAKRESKLNKLVRSPWFWAGVSALVIGGVLVHQSQSTETVIQPTHGFH